MKQNTFLVKHQPFLHKWSMVIIYFSINTLKNHTAGIAVGNMKSIISRMFSGNGLQNTERSHEEKRRQSWSGLLSCWRAINLKEFLSSTRPNTLGKHTTVWKSARVMVHLYTGKNIRGIQDQAMGGWHQSTPLAIHSNVLRLGACHNISDSIFK